MMMTIIILQSLQISVNIYEIDVFSDSPNEGNEDNSVSQTALCEIETCNSTRFKCEHIRIFD